MAKLTTSNYDIANDQSVKEPIIVLEIEGLPFVFSSANVYRILRYDEVGKNYDAGYSYDQLIQVDNNKPYIDRKGSSSTISQKLEQWDGKASIETMSIKLIDKNQLLTKVCTPGFYIDEIINKKATVRFGYANLSYPEDYIKIFQGYINNYKLTPGAVFFEFTDPSAKRKQVLFNGSTSRLTNPIITTTSDVTISIASPAAISLADNTFNNDSPVVFSTTGALPTGITAGTTYFVINATTASFQISATVGGSAINTSGTQSGTHSVKSSLTVINLTSTSNLYRTITDAKGNVDSGVTIGIHIGDEIITYTNADIVSGFQLSGVTRGAYGTTIADAAINDEVKCFIAINDNPVNVALKVMLSGWNDAWIKNIDIDGIVNTVGLGAGVLSDSITFGSTVDLNRDYGLVIGDYIIIHDSPNPSNNGVFTIADILNNGRTVLVAETGLLVQENPPITLSKCDFRSKYDVYPIDAGLSLSPDDVAVNIHESVRDTFVNIIYDNLKISGEESSGKTWIETELFKPIGGYSLTQGSRISMGITRPPLATELKNIFSATNVTNPKNIVVTRGKNSRFFYNEVVFNYNYDFITGTYFNELRYVDADAQGRLDAVSVLEISLKGLKVSPTNDAFLVDRAQKILQRYRYGSELIELDTQFGIGHKFDAGDVVVLKDDAENPVLQISNTQTGERGIASRVMEIQERSIYISDGKASFSLLSNNGFSETDRYAVVAPSSQVDGTYANTTSLLRISNDPSSVFPSAEYKKWEDYEGSKIRIHNVDFSQDEETTFTMDNADFNVFHLVPALSFAPNATHFVEFASYDESSASINSLVKTTFAHFDPSASILSGSSSNVFTLNTGLSSRYSSGEFVYVISPDGSRYSPDVKIISIVGDIITIGPINQFSSNQNLGFTPQANDIMQLAGFLDQGSGYRYL